MKKNSIEEKRKREQAIVKKMIEIYCKKKHKSKDLCEDCKNLLEYTTQRSDNCRFIEQKTFCASCKVHCYKPQMREKIREVMKFSGKYLIFYYPKEFFLHLIDTIIDKMKSRKSSTSLINNKKKGI